MKIITHAWLAERKACKEQLDIFDKEWPDGMELTKENLLKCAALQLNLNWIAEHYLDASLSAKFEKQRDSLLAEFERQEAPFWAEYERQRGPFWAEYERQEAIVLFDLLRLSE